MTFPLATISIITCQLTHIAEQLKSSPLTNRVAIVEESNGMQSAVRVLQEDNGWSSWLGRNFSNAARWAYNKSPLSYFFGSVDSSVKEVVSLETGQHTAGYFHRVFGEKRICKIDKNLSIQFQSKKEKQDYFCKEDVEKIFVASAEVTVEDLEEIFSEIKDVCQTRVRFLSERETKFIRTIFQDIHTCKELSKTTRDILCWLLSPFSRVEHIFLYRLPLELSFQAVVCGENHFEKMRKRVCSYEAMRILPQKSQLWSLYLAKEISGRSPPQGVLIPHLEGYYENFHKIAGGGELKYLLKSMDITKVASCILYSGTRPFDSASRMENFRSEIGSKGPFITFDETKSFLCDSKKGFVRSPKERVEAIGFSQGANHAQIGALLFVSKFSRIVTVCSPGIKEKTAREYAAKLKMSGTTVVIEHIIEQNDLISKLGKARLGLACPSDKAQVRVFLRLHDKNQNNATEEESCPGWFLKAIWKIISSASEHLRPVIGRTNILQELSDAITSEGAQFKKYLLHSDEAWEVLRQRLSNWHMFRVQDAFVDAFSNPFKQSRADIELITTEVSKCLYK